MGIIQNVFGRGKTVTKLSRYRELGTFQAIFGSFGSNMFKSDIVRSCVRPLAEYSSKANATCTNSEYEKILNYRPNMYMTGHDFLAKVRTNLELKNTAFIYIIRNDGGRMTGLYPIPYKTFEGVENGKRLFVRFRFNSSEMSELVVPWEDLAVVRKDYNERDIGGDENDAILNALELLYTSDQSVSNAVKSTANLRGLLKTTKGMLSDEDLKAQRDRFVESYMSMSNEGGIAPLDATQEFVPISMNPVFTNADQMKEFRERVERYFGVNEKIITNSANEDERLSFYEGRIEPFLIALSQELTRKVFSERELGFGNQILYEANRLQFSSMATKISVYKEVVLYGGMTINEWRLGCNMDAIEGGDERIMRLDAATVDKEGKTDESKE